MLVTSASCTWDVSEQGNKGHKAACAKCSSQFEAGDLRLRPTGTKKTRLIHPECSHGLVTSLAAISNLDVLSLPCRQRLERAMSHAVSAHGAAGDVPHPDIADPSHAELQPLRATTNNLKHLELLD